MNKSFLLLAVGVILLVEVTSKVTDEEYASMPQLFTTEDYDGCLMMGKNALYCYVTFELAPLDNKTPAPVWNIIKETSSSPLRYRHDLIRQFICVPKSCPTIRTLNDSDPRFKDEINRCFNDKYRSYDLQGTLQNVSCRTADPVYQVDLVDYTAAYIICIYIIFVTFLSFYDSFKRYETQEKYEKFKESSGGKLVTTFSIPSNWSKLRTSKSGGDFDKLKSVQGLRVYMTFIVIAVHSCFTVVGVPTANPQWMEQLNENPELLGEFPKRGIYLLSFHFMTSAWMLMNSMLAKTDKGENIDVKFILKSVVKRYVRFLPTVAVAVGFYATWFRHIPYGPYWERVCEESDRCRQNWWANILFIQNFVDRYNMCHIISWYLAVEMHYYIISLFLIMFVLKYRWKIPVAVFFLLILSMSLCFWDHYRHGYPSSLSGNPEEIYNLNLNKKPQWHDHFASYHGNFSGSIVGFGFGYYYYKYKNKELFNKKVSTALWWILSIGLIVSVVYVPMLFNFDKTTVHAAAWVAASRPMFSIGIGLLVLGMSHGLGGCVKWTFEWGPLQTLAKLSYCVYLFHTIFQNIRTGIMRSTSFISYYSFATLVLADITTAFLASMVLSLLFEMPANEIANRLFVSQKKEEKKEKKKK